MKWTDVTDIAVILAERHPEIDPVGLRFTDLMRWVTELEEFDDDVSHCNERILEAIQAAWIEEA